MLVRCLPVAASLNPWHIEVDVRTRSLSAPKFRAAVWRIEGRHEGCLTSTHAGVDGSQWGT
jgi:hypothetical protein